MASTKASNNRVAWSYSSDDGQDYRISAKAAYVLDGVDGAKFGGAAAIADNKRIPLDIKPRKVCCTAAGHADRWVVCYDTTAPLWTTAGTTVTLDDLGVDVVYTSECVAARRNEKRRRNISVGETS